MSIYYNLKTDNIDMLDVKPAEFFSICNENILEDQTQYSVGINRFKIPLGNVDFFRIYPNRYNIAFCFNASNPTPNGTRRKREMVDLYSANANNDSEVDRNFITNSNTIQLPNRYNTIQSHEHFCKVLNRGLAHSLYKRLSKSTDSVTHNALGDFSLSHANSTNPAYNYYDVNFAGLEGGQPLKIAEKTMPDSADIWLYDLRFKFNPKANSSTGTVSLAEMFKDVSGTGDMLFSDFQWTLDAHNQKTGDAKVEFSMPLFHNVGRNIGLNQFYTNFNNGVEFRISSKIGTTDDTYAVIQGNVSGQNPKVCHIYNEVDLENLMCRNVRNWKFTINCRYTGKNPIDVVGTKPRFRVVRDATDQANSGFEFEVRTTVDDFFDRDYRTFNDSLGIIDSFPMFQYNKTTTNVELRIQRDYLYGRGFAIFVNNGLKNLLGFDVCSPKKILDIQNTITGLPVYFDGYYDSSTEAESVIGFTNQNSGNFLRLNDANQVEDTSAGTNIYVTIPEEENSNYKRNFLDGIVIMSPSLAVRGEFSADGQEKQKILTDFVIDPSIVGRDFLVYQPEGNIRYAKLNAMTPLRDLLVQVYYRDINNNIQRLNVPNGATASIKIEFRPNNQIQNY